MKQILKNVLFICALAFSMTTFAQVRFVLNTNGTEVTDNLTGLIWQRCSVGQSWNGTSCVGTPAVFTHEQALNYATQYQPKWRLPNAKELGSIIDRSFVPAVHPVYFPGTNMNNNQGIYWTSTPKVDLPSADFAWIFEFSSGSQVPGDRTGMQGFYSIRLVR